ncbi:MAG: GNAT family N-acetyltransferase [Anaerolineae bacterium]
MNPITICQLTGQEQLDAMFNLGSYAFKPSPPFPDKEAWLEVARAREGVTYLAVLEEGRAVAGMAASSMSENVRGRLYETTGIWGVATDPAARRRGYVRQLIAELFAERRAAGHVLSTLYPFRESFYERMGYATFPLSRIARFKPAALASLLRQDFGGEVERVFIGDGFPEYREFLYRLQARVHGMGVFHLWNKVAAQRGHFWLALAKVGGETVGVMRYELTGDEITQFLMRASNLYSLTSQGKYLLLQWIARHVDQAGQVELALPAFEHPETWLADLSVKLESAVRAPMGRVLDVSALGGMQTGPGCFSARIADPLCAWNDRVWRFETVDGALRVEPADKGDCTLSIQGLSGLVYGTHDPADFAIRGWGDASPDLQVTLRSMFPAVIPYLHEEF